MSRSGDEPAERVRAVTYDVAARTIGRWGETAEERTGHAQVKGDTAVLVVEDHPLNRQLISS